MYKNIVFNLYNVLINKNIDIKQNIEFLKELNKIAKEKSVDLYLVTGLEQDTSKQILKEYNLDKSLFSRIVDIDNDYLNSLSSLDLESRKQSLSNNKYYIDHYLKVYFINKLKSKTLFIGNDIWLDAYYVSNYTDSDVVLIKDSLSYNNQTINKTEFNTLHLIDLNIETIKDYLENKKEFDYSKLKKFAKEKLIKGLLGDGVDFSNIDLNKIIKKKK